MEVNSCRDFTVSKSHTGMPKKIKCLSNSPISATFVSVDGIYLSAYNIRLIEMKGRE